MYNNIPIVLTSYIFIETRKNEYFKYSEIGKNLLSYFVFYFYQLINYSHST